MKSVPSVYKFGSRKEWEVHVWKKLVEGLAKATSSQGIERSLEMLVTAHERKQIIKRAAAVSLLRQGKTYREIGEMLWLSPTTISAIRKSMRVGEGYVSRYTRRKKREKLQKPLTKKEWRRLRFKLWIEAIFTLPPPPTPRRHTRRTGRIIQPHGKLVFAQRSR